MRLSATTNVRYFYSARLVAGQGPIRYVRIAIPVSDVQDVQAGYAWLVGGVVFTTMAFLILIGYVAVRRLSRPMERMALAVERSAAGDVRLDLPEDGGEEIERLGHAVRRMRQALVQKVVELESERSVLSSVVAGMREGLLLVGADRRIRLANAALREVFDLSFDPQGHLLAEVVRHPAVIRDVDAALSRGVEVHDSVLRQPGSGRSFQLQVTPLGGSGGREVQQALALFFDVTRLERLDAVRREFVANVSHELRTPLTSIKAFVEMLQDGDLDDEKNARRFLDIIRKHADRMGDLIEDLTDLSLIETGAIALELRAMDAAEVVRGVLEHLQPLAHARNVRVVSELPAPFPIAADRRRFEQMLTNLLDNAVKFSNPHGRVWIRGERNPRSSVLCVEDEGIGIPMESIEKVFNRFYQENRARSRELGGTGLGLAIVKHLMRLHGGRVRVESELGRGSRFYLDFPVRGDAG